VRFQDLDEFGRQPLSTRVAVAILVDDVAEVVEQHPAEVRRRRDSAQRDRRTAPQRLLERYQRLAGLYG